MIVLYVLFLGGIVSGILSAFLLRDQKVIPPGWILFFNITCTLVIGLVITFCSRKRHKQAILKDKNISPSRLILSCIFLLIGSFLLILDLVSIFNQSVSFEEVDIFYVACCIAAAFTGAGVYLLQNRKTHDQAEIDEFRFRHTLNTWAFYKRAMIIVSCLLILLSFFNPSMQQFRDYLGTNTSYKTRRIANWIIYSVYQDSHGEQYIGFLSNFYKVDK